MGVYAGSTRWKVGGAVLRETGVPLPIELGASRNVSLITVAEGEVGN